MEGDLSDRRVVSSIQIEGHNIVAESDMRAPYYLTCPCGFEDPTLDLRNANLRVLTDNEDIHTFQYERVKDGQRVRQTNVTFFKDGKIYRHMGHDVPI